MAGGGAAGAVRPARPGAVPRRPIKRRMGELKLSVPRTGQQRIEVYHALKADLGAADDLMGDVTGQPLLVTVDDKQAGREYQE